MLPVVTQDADDLQNRLDEVDRTIKAKLAELGFTPDEIQRQMDRSIPEELKQAERNQILASKLAADLRDPSTGLMDRVIAANDRQRSRGRHRDRWSRHRPNTPGLTAGVGRWVASNYGGELGDRTPDPRLANHRSSRSTRVQLGGIGAQPMNSEVTATQAST